MFGFFKFKSKKTESRGRITVHLQKPETPVTSHVDSRILLEDKNTIRSVLLFGPPQNKIVTVSGRTQIWDSETSECLKVLENQNIRGKGIEKINNSSFLFSSDRTIRCFSILYPKFEELKRFEVDYDIQGPKRLTDDMFIFYCRNDYVSILSLSQEKIIKTYYIRRRNCLPKVLCTLSTKYPNSFYIPSRTSKETELIKLIDFKNDKVTKHFELSPPLLKEYRANGYYKNNFENQGINTITVFTNSRDEEILIISVPYHYEDFIFFNTSKKKFKCNKKLSTSRRSRNFRRLIVTPCIKNCFFLRDEYFVCVTCYGKVNVFEMKESEDSECTGPGFELIKKKEVHVEQKTQIGECQWGLKSYGSKVWLDLIYSMGPKVKRSKLVRLEDKMRSYEENDRFERIHFLREFMEMDRTCFFGVSIPPNCIGGYPVVTTVSKISLLL